MKTVFWNVDTQYDFMRDDESFKGTLPVPGARGIEQNLEKMTNLARTRNIQIIFTGDWHTPESKEFSDNPDYKMTFPPHCMMETKGAAYVPAATPQDPFVIEWQEKSFDAAAVDRHKGDIVLYKDAFNVFAGAPESPHAHQCLEIINPSRAIVYGVATNVCVHFAVVGLLEREVEVYAVSDAIKELPELPLRETLAEWERKGAHLITVNEAQDYI